MLNKSLPGQKPSLGYQEQREISHRRPLWLREFKESGPDAVRDGIKGKDWSQAKKIVAREWLETLEMQAWQAKRPESEDEKPYFRDKKWWIYFAGGVLVALALFRMRRFL
jgi:hypothetical protein